MKSIVRAIFLVLLIILTTLSSQSQIDSLKMELSRSLPDSTYILLNNELLKAYINSRQFEEARSLSSTLIEEFQAKDNANGLQMAMLFKALVLNLKGEREIAIQLCKEGAQLSFEIGDSLQAAKHLTNVGAFFQQQGQRDSALSFYLQAYPIYNRFEEYRLLSRVLNNIAILYRQLEEYEKAISIYNESLTIRKNLEDRAGIATSYMNIGLLYSYLQQMDEAESYLLNAVSIFNQLEIEDEVASCYTALGNIYFNLGCYQEARTAVELAYAYFEKDPDPWFQTSNAYLLGALDLIAKQYKSAEQKLQEAVQLGKTANRWGDKQELFLSLSKAKYELGKDKEAYEALLVAFEHLDSVRQERRLALVEENLARFEVLQAEKELAVNQLKLERRTRQRNLLISSIVLLVLLGIGLSFLFRQRMLIANQKTKLQQQHIQQLQQEKKLTALNAIIEGEEKERFRIAADLHDGLGGLLMAVKTHYSQLLNTAGHSKLYEKTSTLIDEAYTEVRQISYNLAPRAISISGLKGAIEDLCLTLQHQGLACELEIIGLEETQLEKNAVHIYRIVQELCNNSLKHANASGLFVQLFQKDGFLSILVEDDGDGFDQAKIQAAKGLGISSIESRVKAMNGEIHWYTEPNEGTSVSLRLPL